MNEIKEISTTDTKAKLKDCTIVDIRDPQSFEEAHIEGAQNINDENIENFLASADREKTTIIYCYHGNSSLGAAEYFMENGFSDVYSMAGGFHAWRESNTLI